MIYMIDQLTGCLLYVGVDLGIFVFTFAGWRRTAFLYFIGTYALNLTYQFWNLDLQTSSTFELFSGALVQLLLSGSIYLFSHLFFKGEPEKADDSTEQKTAEQKQEAALGKQLSSALNAGIRFEAQPYLCPQCGDSFSDRRKLNGHVSGHKQTNEWMEVKYGNWEDANERRATLATQIRLNA